MPFFAPFYPCLPLTDAPPLVRKAVVADVSDSGDVLLAVQRLEAARTAYAAEVSRAPGNVLPRLGLMRVLLRLDRWDDALATGQKTTMLFPKSADAFGLYALALLRAGRLDKAKTQTAVAVRQNADSYWGLVAAGRIATVEGESLLAHDLLSRVIRLYPSEPEGLLAFFLSAHISTDEAEGNEKSKILQRLIAQKNAGTVFEAVTSSYAVYLKNKAQHHQAFGERTPNRAVKGTVPTKNNSVLVPFEIIHDQIVLPVTIDGEALHLALDTGGSDAVVVYEEAAKKLRRKSTVVSAGAKQFGGVGGMETVAAVKAERLTLGTLAFLPVELTVTPRVLSDKGIDGSLGGDLLMDYEVTLNMNLKVMLIRPSVKVDTPLTQAVYETEKEGAVRVWLPFRMLNEKIMLPMLVNKTERFWATLDTGATTDVFSLRVARSILKNAKPEKIHKETVNHRLGYGTSKEKPEIWAAETKFSIGYDTPGYEDYFDQTFFIALSSLDKQISPMMQFEAGAILGYPFLSVFDTVAIDYPNRYLYLRFMPEKTVTTPPAGSAATTSTGPLFQAPEGTYWSFEDNRYQLRRLPNKKNKLPGEILLAADVSRLPAQVAPEGQRWVCINAYWLLLPVGTRISTILKTAAHKDQWRKPHPGPGTLPNYVSLMTSGGFKIEGSASPFFDRMAAIGSPVTVNETVGSLRDFSELITTEKSEVHLGDDGAAYVILR